MSQGQSTQRVIKVSMIVTFVAIGIAIALMGSYTQRNTGYIFTGIAIAASLVYLLFRCKACGHSVVKEADGTRSRRGLIPYVNPSCRNCGADIP